MNIQKFIDLITNPDYFRTLFGVIFILLCAIWSVYLSSKKRKRKIDRSEHIRDIIRLIIVLLTIIIDLCLFILVPWDINNIILQFTYVVMIIYLLLEWGYSIYYRKKINDDFDYKIWKVSMNGAFIMLLWFILFQFREIILKFFWLE